MAALTPLLGLYSVQVLLLVVVAAAAIALVRVPPRARLIFWRAIVIACLLLPLAPARIVTIDVVRLATVTASLDRGSSPLAPIARPRTSLADLVPWIVLTGVVLRGVWLAVGLARLRALTRRSEAVVLSDELRVLRNALAPAADISWHHELQQPVTFGLRRPVVLLPARLRESSPEIQRAVVCHELVHVDRGDWAAMIVEELILTALWFHPAIWWAMGQVQLNREATVDARVVDITGARRTYMEALLAFADAGAPALAPVFARRRQIVTRIRLLSREVVMSRMRLIVGGITLATLIIGSSWSVVAAVPIRTELRYRTVSAPASGADVLLPATAPILDSSPAPTPPPATPRTEPARVPREQAKYQGQPISLDFQGADLAAVMKVFSDISGLNLVVDPKVHGTVTVALKDIPWDQALDIVLKENGLSYAMEGTSVRISASPAPGDAQQGVIAQPPPPPPPPDGKTNPRVIADPKPGYPTDALRYSPDATVWVRMEIGAGGDVTAAKATRWRLTIEHSIEDPNYWASKPERAFVDAAEAAALRWKFAPPGANTRTAIQTVFTFRNVPGRESMQFDVVSARAATGGPAVRVGGNIKQPVKVRDVKPVYPEDARAAGVQGVVIVELRIGVDGSVRDATILRSIPMLDEAALAAVRQWQFAPTLLNGEPTELLMTVTVNFTGLP